MNGIHHQRRGLSASIRIGVLGLALGLTQPAALAQTGTAAKPFLDEASAAAAGGNYVDAHRRLTASMKAPGLQGLVM